MGSDQAPNNSFQVYSLICGELSKILDRMKVLVPEIESARPGGTLGIQELCALNNSVDKAKLLLRGCAESSKLYLAITREATLAKCERIKDSMIRSLCHIRDMVPSLLAHKITGVLDLLRKTAFVVDPAEEEAGRALLQLLQQADCSPDLEYENFQVAALRLKLTSPTAILVEKRCLKKLLEKFKGSDVKKEKILKYFLHLVEKHGKNLKLEGGEHKPRDRKNSALLTAKYSVSASDYGKIGESGELVEAPKIFSTSSVPPEKFCCPISSRLMYDPVVITSGQTYERKNIEQWFGDGHDTCPKTGLKLESLSVFPNSSMKVLIADWCREHGIEVSDEPCEDSEAKFYSWASSHTSSISSLKNVPVALADHFLQNDYSNISFMSSDASYCSDSSCVKVVEHSENSQGYRFLWSDDYMKYRSFSSFNSDMFVRFLQSLFELPRDLQAKAVEEVRLVLADDEESCYSMLSNGFPEAIIEHLKNSKDLSDVQKQKTGCKLLLACIGNSRMELSSLDGKDVLQLLSTISSNVSTEALQILHILLKHPTLRPDIVSSRVVSSVIETLYSEDPKSRELSLKILSELSNYELKSTVSSQCLSKLASFVTEGTLVRLCLKIIHSLIDSEENAKSVASNTDCLTAIVDLLDNVETEDQDKAAAVAILFSICSKSNDNCELVMAEGVIPSLVAISVNENAKGRELATKLLHLLRAMGRTSVFTSSNESQPADYPTVVVITQPVSKPSRFFRKIIPRTFTLF